MTKIFQYQDTLGNWHKLTLKRASVEWCNFNCPTLYYRDDENYVWRLNDGVSVEDFIPEMEDLFIQFMIKSSESYYRKYEKDSLSKRNGFVYNLYQTSYKYISDKNKDKLRKYLSKMYPTL